MRWVEAGGHLVVQYGRAAMNRLAPSAPRPGRGRAEPYVPFPRERHAGADQRRDDADAAAGPRAPALHDAQPHRGRRLVGLGAGARDPAPGGKDPRYLELLAATDPFPYNAGEKRGLLVDAKVGKGTWTYVGLVLFRQVPAGVPGGWRLLANLSAARGSGLEIERRWPSGRGPRRGY